MESCVTTLSGSNQGAVLAKSANRLTHIPIDGRQDGWAGGPLLRDTGAPLGIAADYGKLSLPSSFANTGYSRTATPKP